MDNFVCYHLRVTIARDDALKLIPQFIDKFKPARYIFSYEEVKQDGKVNKHIHGHLEYVQSPSKSTMSDWFKKQNLSGKYYHKTLDKDPINNKLYVFKDLDILNHNLSEEEQEELNDETDRINTEKNIPMKQQLLNHIEGANSLEEVAILIVKYHIERDYLPPTRSLLYQYVQFVVFKKLKHLEDKLVSKISLDYEI